MTTTPVTQWRWDRFDVRRVSSEAYTSRNCVGPDREDPLAIVAMHKQVILDKKKVEEIISNEIHLLLREGAEVCGMTYFCKLTKLDLPCMNSKDIRQSWLQNGNEENLQRMAWLFYYYGSETHNAGRSLMHGEWVEQKVMATLNIAYMCICKLRQ